MENNIALNMREIADKVNEEIENAKIARHRKEVETSIIPYIQEFAKKGNMELIIPLRDMMLI